MNKVKFLLIAMMAILMGACSSSDDDKEEKIEINVSSLAGEWYTEDAAASIDMTLEENGLSAEVITYEKVNNGYSMYDIETGSWAYFSANNTLRTSLTSTRNNNQVTRDNQVIKVEANSLRLRNETGSTSTYMRIINSYEISTGQEVSILTEAFGSISQYSTNNSDIISVSNDGTVKGLSYGVGYVTLQTEKGNVVVRIIVKSRVPNFTNLMDKTPEEVSKVLGSPNSISADGEETIWKYNKDLADPGLSQCIIRLSSSNTVKNILTAYKTTEERDLDLAYIQSIYTYDSKSKTFYDNEKGLMYSSVAIKSADQGNIHLISYSSIKAILEELGK